MGVIKEDPLQIPRQRFIVGAQLTYGVKQALIGQKDCATHSRTTGSLRSPVKCQHPAVTKLLALLPDSQTPLGKSPPLTAPGRDPLTIVLQILSKSLTDLPYSDVLKFQ